MDLQQRIARIIDGTDSKVNPFSLSTIHSEGYPTTRMMGIFFRDGLDIYLNSQAPSGKLEQINAHSKVSLFFHTTGYGELLSYYGEAEVVEDPAQRAWAWERFPEAIRRYHAGPQAPSLAIIRIRPTWIELTDRANKQPTELYKP